MIQVTSLELLMVLNSINCTQPIWLEILLCLRRIIKESHFSSVSSLLTPLWCFFPDMSEFPWLASFKRAVANMVTWKLLLVAVRFGRPGEGLVLETVKRNAVCCRVWSLLKRIIEPFALWLMLFVKLHL